MGFTDSKINLFSSLLGERWGREQGPPGEPWFLPRVPSLSPCSLLPRQGGPPPSAHTVGWVQQPWFLDSDNLTFILGLEEPSGVK